MEKKKRVATIQSIRLARYFYRPPYGTRFWILSPFIREGDEEMLRGIERDLGSIPDIRPVGLE